MVKETAEEISFWGPCAPHVLVVEQDTNFGRLLVAELRNRTIRAKHTETVDAFLDLNCRERVDLVSLEIDAMNLDTLDSIILLRTHFGEGPETLIVGSSPFVPGSNPADLEQSGMDTCIAKLSDPAAMACALEAELRRHMKSKELGWANPSGHSD